MDHGIYANGEGFKVNEYTLQIDFTIPEVGIWHAFFQTDPDNAGDADLFTNTSNTNLGQNFPNPFSRSTIFPYEIQKLGNVSFRILDLSGKEIRVIDEGVKSPGKYNLEIYSEKMRNGIYFLRMKTNEITITRKMVVSYE